MTFYLMPLAVDSVNGSQRNNGVESWLNKRSARRRLVEEGQERKGSTVLKTTNPNGLEKAKQEKEREGKSYQPVRISWLRATR